MTDKPIKWADAPTSDDIADAVKALTLVGVREVTLNPARAVYQAKDLLRFARLPALPLNNPGANKWLKRIKSGDELPPVLLVEGSLLAGLPLTIAEGYHRISACYWHGEQTEVAGYFLTLG